MLTGDIVQTCCFLRFKLLMHVSSIDTVTGVRSSYFPVYFWLLDGHSESIWKRQNCRTFCRCLDLIANNKRKFMAIYIGWAKKWTQ